MEGLRVISPAKVNLFLGVGERQEDGYHETVSIMHALALHDFLDITILPEGQFHPDLVKKDGYDLPTVEKDGIFVGIKWDAHEYAAGPVVPLEDNLITKAVFTLAEALGLDWRGYVRISVDKHIPLAAGLGGGSSNAAACLLGLASLWNLEDRRDEVEAVAARLGVDVPFFLQGGCALYDGRGDHFVHSIEPMREYLVLLLPEQVSVSTEAAYRSFDEHPMPTPPRFIELAYHTPEAIEVPLFNGLTSAAERLEPELARVRSWARVQEGVDDVLLTGSGAATYAICDDGEAAMALVVAAKKEGFLARATNFAPWGVAIMED